MELFVHFVNCFCGIGSCKSTPFGLVPRLFYLILSYSLLFYDDKTVLFIVFSMWPLLSAPDVLINLVRRGTFC